MKLKQTLVLIFLLAAGASCDNGGRLEKKESEDLIVNVALLSSHFSAIHVRTLEKSGFQEMRSAILREVRIQKDDSLQIKLALYNPNTFISGIYPHFIIHAASNNNNYAFNFEDEIEGQSDIPEQKNLNAQLKILSEIFLSHENRNFKSLNRFVTLFYDSLLQCHEVTASNIETFARESIENLSLLQDEKHKGCAIELNTVFAQMRQEISVGAARYFTPVKGAFGFWRITIEGDVDKAIFVSFKGKCHAFL